MKGPRALISGVLSEPKNTHGHQSLEHCWTGMQMAISRERET